MKKVYFVSLGCDKNLVDSEHMLGLLISHGFEITEDETLADVIIINTCCFILDAKEESVSTILELAEYRKNGNCSAFVIAGCMAQRYKEEITETLPEVDAVIGTDRFPEILSVLERIENGEKIVDTKTDTAGFKRLPRVSVTGGHFEYLKIAEGCDKRCTYCIIPSLRGPYRSIPMEELLEEARDLAERGVKELDLVAQETTLYGTDLYGKKSLHLLLEQLCKINEIKWIRILYCYPEEVYPELLEVMKKEEKICPYLDIPIQHCSDSILKKMGRRTDKAALLEKIRQIRKEVPGIALRTTLITGFPGETTEDFLELKDFIREVGFEHLGVFPYSREEGTPAYDMKDQIEEEEKERRRDELMLLQQEIVFLANKKIPGTICDVFMEGYLPEDDVYVGRTKFQAPGVDAWTYIQSSTPLHSGDIVKCLITDAADYDLIGEYNDESTQ